MFLNHDWNVVLASTYGNEPTLRLAEDARGLFVDADLPDNEWGRPVRDAVARGDISSMSFGFNVVQGRLEQRPQRAQRAPRSSSGRSSPGHGVARLPCDLGLGATPGGTVGHR